MLIRVANIPRMGWKKRQQQSDARNKKQHIFKNIFSKAVQKTKFTLEP